MVASRHHIKVGQSPTFHDSDSVLFVEKSRKILFNRVRDWGMSIIDSGCEKSVQVKNGQISSLKA